MIFKDFSPQEKKLIFARCRASQFDVKAIPLGGVAIFQGSIKSIRQSCYRAKPMKFRVAAYDEYEAGAVAVERIL